MLNRIIILGNSLSIPRPDDQVDYVNTYPYILVKSGYEVINRSRRINDIEIQSTEQNMLDDVDYLRPDYVVIHLGIVECAPRIFSKKNRAYLRILPSKIRNFIINFLSKYREIITKHRKINYVDIVSFEANFIQVINRIHSRNPSIKIVVININNTNMYNNKRSYGFNSNINNYNDVINKLPFKFPINLYVINTNLHKGGLLNDGIHINSVMHKYISDQILSIIRDPCINQPKLYQS